MQIVNRILKLASETHPIHTLALVAIGGWAVAGSAGAAVTNIAPSGTGFIGSASNPALNGQENDHAPTVANSGAAAVNDNDPTTHVDDFPQSTNDYVGVTFATPQSGVFNVQLNMALFSDGGWFGPSNVTPGAGNALSTTDLIAPVVQTTTDGTNWTIIPSTNNYVSVMTGALIGGGTAGNPVQSPVSSFTLGSEADGILGIRLLGNGGGVANRTGFIGISELYVNAPEPASLGLMAVGSLLALRRRRA